MDVMPWLVALPLALAVISAIARGRTAERLVLPGMIAMLVLACSLALEVYRSGTQRHVLAGWQAPLGIELYADGLSAVMLLMTAVIAGVVGIYARYMFAAQGATAVRERFWPMSWLLWAAMNAVYLSADIFNLYVTLELLGLSAVGLVALTGTAVAIAASLRYLLLALLGSLLYLLGVALLYGTHGTLSIEALAGVLPAGPLTTLVLALMSVGLLIKTALFPLHFWLPPAHGSALTPVSALLSGLVMKASFYLMVRLWIDMFGDAVAAPAADVLGWLGAAAIIWGALGALRQRKLKMLVAYSTVAQLGYLFLLFPLTVGADAAHASLAWTGGIFYALSHAFAKAAMFLAAGNIVHAWGEDDIDHLEGTSARLPWSLFAFAAAGITLMGLPPSGGFIGKWLLLRSAIDAQQWWWSVIILLGGLLTAIYVFRVLRSAFFRPLPERTLHLVPRGMQLSALALAILGLVLGLTAALPIELLQVGRPAAPVWP